MFYLQVLSSTHTASRPFLPFCCPTTQGAPTGSWKGTKYRENSKQAAPLNVFFVSSRMEKVLLHATGCLLYSSCSASQSPHYISESQAMCNIFPETLSESKNIPCTVCCTELWPKSRYSLEHYGLSNKIMRFFFPLRALKGLCVRVAVTLGALQEPAGGCCATQPGGKLQAGLVCLLGGQGAPYSCGVKQLDKVSQEQERSSQNAQINFLAIWEMRELHQPNVCAARSESQHPVRLWEQLSFLPNQSRLKHLALLLILWEEPSYARVLQ